MTHSLVYRAATLDDVQQLMQLGVASYGMYTAFLTPQNMEKMKSSMRNLNTWTGLLMFAKGLVCVHDEQIAGMVFLVPSGQQSELFPQEWSHIRLLGVHPQFQGKGIATALTKWCIEQAGKDGEQVIALHTGEMMNAARHIYEKLGFVMWKEIPRRLDVRYWIYTLELKGHPV